MAERKPNDQIGLREAAEYCDVSRTTIRRYIADGRLPAVRVGPKILRVRVADLDKILTTPYAASDDQ
jgi:excisionase family DNA binding protein